MISPSGLQGLRLHRHGLLLIHRHGRSKDHHWVTRVRYLVLASALRVARVGKTSERSRRKVVDGGRKEQRNRKPDERRARAFYRPPGTRTAGPLSGKISRVLGGSRPVHGVRPCPSPHVRGRGSRGCGAVRRGAR
jgi:hypothetical protein